MIHARLATTVRTTRGRLKRPALRNVIGISAPLHVTTRATSLSVRSCQGLRATVRVTRRGCNRKAVRNTSGFRTTVHRTGAMGRDLRSAERRVTRRIMGLRGTTFTCLLSGPSNTMPVIIASGHCTHNTVTTFNHVAIDKITKDRVVRRNFY